MRTTTLVVAVLGLAMVSGCTPGVQRRDGDAAPAGSPGRTTLAATGTPGASSPGTAPQTTPQQTVEAVGRCRTSNLRGAIEPFTREGHAGAEQSARLGLTNTGSTPCDTVGYPGIQLLDANGQPRPTKVFHPQSATQPGRITLAPGQTAWTEIVWVFTPNPDEENSSPLCGPKPVAALVTPPDETASLRITASFGTVCRHGEVAVFPLSLTRPQ
jgi:hypothetical protein